ncbi:hypothetical protein ACFX4I_14760 [Peribacillus sp. YIM B13472]|uniref:hypothetical protein n=1 Tax=Peribacillus sp. YIM B13472 TaxID=3366297 RepID=UPI00366ACA1E
MCCPNPQFLSLSTCGTFNDPGEAPGETVFDNTGGPVLSGYVTLTNNFSSQSAVTLSNDATPIILAVAPGDSLTEFVANTAFSLLS